LSEAGDLARTQCRTKNETASANALLLPGPVLGALSAPGTDPTRFGAVIKAFGTLPTDGQDELANRLK
jgi:hypothetical protein